MKSVLARMRGLRWLLYILLVMATMLGAAYAVLAFSPWPSAYLLRREMAKDVPAMAHGADAYVPKDIVAKLDVAFGEHDDERLDIYYPPGAEKAVGGISAIVWIHGGGFIAGDKADVAGYLKVIAGLGHVAVSVNYSLAPGATYPSPVAQANAALAFLAANAGAYHVDPTQFLLAGDSAGAQIAAQLAAVITDPGYASAVGVTPGIAPGHLKGAILFCGLYDPAKLKLVGDFGAYVTTLLWSYFGVKDFMRDPRLSEFAVNRHVSPHFPPTFISVGNDDPLEPQSKLLADAIEAQGVAVRRFFFPDHYDPPQPHEYQFNLNAGAGRSALNELTEFLATVTK